MQGLFSTDVKLPSAITKAAKALPALQTTGEHLADALDSSRKAAYILGGVAAVGFLIWLLTRAKKG